MVEIGRVNRLMVINEVDFGVYLDGKQLGDILLPTKECPDGCKRNDWLTVFIYRDSEDRLIATTTMPRVMVGECAYVKVKEVNNTGAFLDWGLPKDLLVPYSEMYRPMEAGRFYVVYLYVDEKSQRIAATSKLDGVLEETTHSLAPKQEVELIIWGRSNLGYKAVINHTYLGLIFNSEVFKPLNIGQSLKGYIKNIRDDGKIDLTLQNSFRQVLDELSEKILSDLEAKGGTSLITDKSSADEIYHKFGVSKKAYKKTLGKLYKERKIVIEKDKITLSQ